MRSKKESTRSAETGREQRQVQKQDRDLLRPSEAAELLLRISGIFLTGGVQNRRAANTLRYLSKRLSQRGVRTIDQIFAPPQSKPQFRRGHWDATPHDAEVIKRMTLDEIRAIVGNPETTKDELITLAKIRFGTPSARLLRMPKTEVAQSVLSVVENEEALTRISEQARATGRRRS